MKASQVRPEASKLPVEQRPCLSCGKLLKLPYGTFSEGWVCSKACNTIHLSKRYKR